MNFNIFCNIFMSIYSGFATRQQEEHYDACVHKALLLLQNTVQELLDSHAPSLKFCHSFNRLYHHMRKMEEFKYLKPKHTEAI